MGSGIEDDDIRPDRSALLQHPLKAHGLNGLHRRKLGLAIILPSRGRCLGVEVEDDDAVIMLSEDGGQMQGDSRFSDPSLLVDDGDDLHGFSLCRPSTRFATTRRHSEAATCLNADVSTCRTKCSGRAHSAPLLLQTGDKTTCRRVVMSSTRYVYMSICRHLATAPCVGLR